MNSFFAEYIPTFLLFDASQTLRVFALLFLVVFLGIFLFLTKRYHLFAPSNTEVEFRQKRYARVGIFLALMLFFGAGFFVERYRSIALERSADAEEYVLVGEQRDIPEGRVLGEEDNTTSEDTLFVPKSQNFRLGSITVGGDSQIYLADQENKPLELFSVAYKTIIEENRENTGAIIRWQTNKPSRGEVKYRKASDTEFRSAKETSFSVDHTLVLEKLGYSGTYVFFIETKDKWGNIAESEKYALYSGSDSPSLFDLLAGAFGDIFGWAMQK